MPQLPDVITGNDIEASDINDRYHENYIWADHVNANGKNLLNASLFGATSAVFSDGINSTVHIEHGSSPVGNSAVIEGQGGTTLVLSASALTGALAGNSKFALGHVTIPDGSTLALAVYCLGGSYGSLRMISTTGPVFGEVWIQGSSNNVVEISDQGGKIAANTDTAGQLCVLAAGGGVYNLKNRLGSSADITLVFAGR